MPNATHFTRWRLLLILLSTAGMALPLRAANPAANPATELATAGPLIGRAHV